MTSLQKTLDIVLDDIYTNWKNQEQVKHNIALLEELRGNLSELKNRLNLKNA